MAGGFRGILELCGVWLAKTNVVETGGTPSTTYPHGHRGSLTLPAGVTGLRVGAVTWSSRPRTIDITGRSFGSGSGGGVDDKSRAYARGLPSEELLLSGWVGASKYGFGHRSSLTIGTVEVEPHVWQLTKTWPLHPIAGRRFGGGASGGDARGKWTWGVPTYALSFSGTPRTQDAEGLIETEEFLITIGAASIGTIAFAQGVHADRWHQVTPLTGGRPSCSFAGRYEGPITYTPGSKPNDLSWLFIDPAVDSDEPVRGAVTLDLSGEEVMAATALLYSVTLHFNRAGGGQIRFDARLRVDSEVL